MYKTLILIILNVNNEHGYVSTHPCQAVILAMGTFGCTFSAILPSKLPLALVSIANSFSNTSTQPYGYDSVNTQ